MSNIRFFALAQEASITDPAYVNPLTEFHNIRVEGKPTPMLHYTGWRAHLITWLIKKLIPYPEGLYD